MKPEHTKENRKICRVSYLILQHMIFLVLINTRKSIKEHKGFEIFSVNRKNLECQDSAESLKCGSLKTISFNLSESMDLLMKTLYIYFIK